MAGDVVVISLAVMLLNRKSRLEGFLFALYRFLIVLVKLLLAMESGVCDSGVHLISLKNLPIFQLRNFLGCDVLVIT